MFDVAVAQAGRDLEALEWFYRADVFPHPSLSAKEMYSIKLAETAKLPKNPVTFSATLAGGTAQNGHAAIASKVQ
jgi:hypothetical protein